MKLYNKTKAIAIYMILFLIDAGIFLTIGCHWKTERTVSNNTFLELWRNNK